MTRIDFDLVVEILAARGVAARVTPAGADHAILVVGPEKSPAYCGPGWFEGPGLTRAFGVDGGLYIHGEKEDGARVQANTEIALAQELVSAVRAFCPVQCRHCGRDIEWFGGMWWHVTDSTTAMTKCPGRVVNDAEPPPW